MHEQYYTPEQLEQLAARREALGEEGMRKAQDDWAELIAAVEAEREQGTDPAEYVGGRWRRAALDSRAVRVFAAQTSLEATDGPRRLESRAATYTQLRGVLGSRPACCSSSPRSATGRSGRSARLGVRRVPASRSARRTCSSRAPTGATTGA